MVFRDILLVLDTYPDPTPPSAMDDALAIAQALSTDIRFGMRDHAAKYREYIG